ncbi:TIGR02452 family protein, partial [Paratractidigestivibacter sp.]|uniref:TIGR02452 family protein n=1 Tax=Paratractidigestivibacter sp. TaxID=2847316 RepID=UPI003A94C327
MTDRKRTNPRKEARAAEAERHIADVERRLAPEVAASVAGIRTYGSTPASEPVLDDGAPRVPSVTVVDEDSVTAVLARGRGLASACDLAVLDFASFTSAGGGYARGAWAQEEALCAESTLYNVLATQKAWYAENRRRNINCELYRNRALVVPRVRFDREKYHSYADVIVAAAPNARRARTEYRVSDEALAEAMRGRIRLVLAVADELGHEKLVLGAFGCGVFGWDAGQVAEMFRAELASGGHAAREVVFAVPRGRFDENLERFEHAFAKFPEANADPYVPRAEREATATRAAA